MIWKIHTYRWTRRKSKNEEKVDAYRYYIGMDVWSYMKNKRVIALLLTLTVCLYGYEKNRDKNDKQKDAEKSEDTIIEDDYPDSILNDVELDGIEFSFARFSQSETATIYAYSVDLSIDGEFIERSEETDDLYLAAEEVLAGQGYTVLSDEVADEKFKEVRANIGFTDEIYNADITYYEY